MSGRQDRGRSATGRSNAPLTGEELHFKTGIAGWLARLLGKIRAAGDSYDHTVVIPTIIVPSAIKLADAGYVGYWLPIVALILTCTWAGAWMGICYGIVSTMRAMLRGMLVGAIEGAVYAALTPTLDRHQAVTLALQLIYINFALFWISHFYVAIPADVSLISEAQWQMGVPRRAWLLKVIRISLGVQGRLGESIPVGLAASIIKFFCLLVLSLLLDRALEFRVLPEFRLRMRAGMPPFYRCPVVR